MERTRDRNRTIAGGATRGLLALTAAAALFAACASPGGGATTAPTSAPATSAPASAAPMTEPPRSAPPASMAAAGLVKVTTNADFGGIVTDADGKTLYIFTPDADAPGKSVCNGDCAAAWPPLTVDAAGDATGTGVTGAIATITRDDGSLQVTLGGNPLYYFAGDKAAGETKGQGLNDVWWIAGADGKGITEKSGGEIRY